MKAALFYGGQDIRLAEVPDPRPGPGEALVRVKAAGICGSDLHNYRDPARTWPGLKVPYMTGHELAGEIAALGPGLEGPHVDQRVGVEPRHLVGCGQCRWCRRGDYQLCPEMGLQGGKRVYSTGFAEYSLEPAAKLYPLPEAVSLEEASILDVYACAVHALHRVPASPLQTVVVQGAGPIGLATAELYRLGGARRVIVCGRGQATLQAAQTIGAGAVVDVAQADPVQAVLDLTAGQGADLVVEAVGGAGEAFIAGLKMLGRGGTMLILGNIAGPLTVRLEDAQRKEANLVWSWSYGLWQGVSEFKIALDLLAAGRLKASELVTHTFPLDHICDAFAAANNKRESGAVKVLVLP